MDFLVQFIVNQVPFLAVYILCIAFFDKNVLYMCILYLVEGNKDFLLNNCVICYFI